MSSELKRAAEQWEKCDPKAMARMSEAAIMYALADAKSDVLRMHAEIKTLRAALAAGQAPAQAAPAAVAGPIRDLHPEKCPITGRPFFMVIDHPELGDFPTYGGPFDSYTIPTPDGEPTDPWHERKLRCERFDHDAGYWVEGGELIPLRIVHEDVLFKLQEDAEAAAPTPQQEAQEPVYAFRRKGLDDFCTCTEKRYAELSARPNLFETRIFYTAPQPVEREPLTSGQIWGSQEIMGFNGATGGMAWPDLVAFVRAIEAAHGITQKGGQHDS